MGVPGLIGEIDPIHPMDILVAIPPQHYLIYDASKNVATPNVIFDTTVSFLGTNVFLGHEIVFDLDQSRIGFAEQDCAEGLSLISAPSAGNKTVAGNNSAGGGSVASDTTVTTSTTVPVTSKSLPTGQGYTNSGGSAGGGQALGAISDSTSSGGGTATETAVVSTSAPTTQTGLPKPLAAEAQTMRYGPAVTTPHSFAATRAAAAAAASSTINTSGNPQSTGGSNLLWFLMAGAAFLLGLVLTVCGTRDEHAPKWAGGGSRAGDGLSVLDANTTVFGGGRKQAFGGTNRSVMGSKQAYEGPNSAKSAYEGPRSTKQVYEGPTTTKQGNVGSGSDHTKSLSTSTGKESQHSMYSKGIFGGGKKQEEVRPNDAATVATGWSQNSGSFFSYANRSKAQSQEYGGANKEVASDTRSSTESFHSSKTRKGYNGKDEKDDTATAFTYGSQSYFGHNLD